MTKKYYYIFLAVILALTGCASTKTSQAQYAESEKHLAQQNYAEAIQIIEKAKEKSYKEKDRVLYWLDVGLLYHYNGDFEMSNEVLTNAEFAIEDLYTKSFSKAVASGLLNDNALDYFGEDYEDIYLNVFKCLNYLELDQFDDAFVEIRRVDVKLNLLEDKYKKIAEEYNGSSDAEGKLVVGDNRFHNDALARYISFLMYRAEKDIDNARIDRDKLQEAYRTQGHIYDFSAPNMPVLTPPAGKAPLNIMAFTGMCPNKLAETVYLDSGNGVIFITTETQSKDYISNLVGFEALPMPGVDAGFHMKIQFPRMIMRGSRIDRIEVLVNGEQMGNLQLLENMQKIAEETFLVRLPLIVSKTIIRAVSKGIVKEVSTDAASDVLEDELGVGGFFLGLVIDIAADVAVDATENADLRISHFFPAYAYVGELLLDPGIYEVEIRYYSGNDLLYTDIVSDVVVKTTGLNLLETFYLQ